MDKNINIKEAMNYINFKKNTPKDSNIYALINNNILIQEKLDATDPTINIEKEPLLDLNKNKFKIDEYLSNKIKNKENFVF